MTSMPADLQPWLLSAEAEPLLSAAAEAALNPAAVDALRRRLVKGPDAASKAALVLELVELRKRAAAKFPQAAQMFFTRKGYEQATDSFVARYKAQRFSGLGRVVDACCGIGGDLMGLAETVPDCVGIDADRTIATYAERNVEACGLSASVETTTLTADNLPDGDAWHVDPDRRPDGQRTTDPDAHQPALSTLEHWYRRVDAGVVKLAPAARLPDSWQTESELEWISHRGECRQLVAWRGRLAEHRGRRRATRLAQGHPPASFVGLPDVMPTAAEALGDWVHEPDPCVLAAKLQGDLARQLGLAALTPGVAYFTSNAPAGTPLAASFRVRETLPLDRKRLAGWLSVRHVGRLEIKVRGCDIRPETLRKSLKPKGDDAATLLISPNAEGKIQVVIAHREDNASVVSALPSDSTDRV